MDRIYTQLIQQHFKEEEAPMLFLAGPRQSGKTTCSEQIATRYQHSLYLNWDEREHRKLILAGSKAIAEKSKVDVLKEKKVLIIFDELHKYKSWKNFLKGFFDVYKHNVHVIVTGSSRLDIFRRGSDSLMGRYFLYRMHPLSLAECAGEVLPVAEIQSPKKIKDEMYLNLYQYGGYPQPYLKGNTAFSNRWQQLRTAQLVREDIRDGTRIQELAQLEVLVEMLNSQGAQQLNYSRLANHIQVSVDTIRRWMNTLSSFYYCFMVKPWHKNIARSLIKEPKLFLWDWSLITEKGARFENFIACHLLKAVHFWTDRGLGNYELFYIRTLEKEEVDFLVTKNKKPWFLVEAKFSGNVSLNPLLKHFQEVTGAEHAFQVAFDLPYVNKDCFKEKQPMIVPARTFLSQLI